LVFQLPLPIYRRNLWDNTHHYIHTTYGISVNPNLERAVFSSICKKLTSKSTGVSFIDDSGLAYTSTFKNDSGDSFDESNSTERNLLVKKLKKLSQHWKRLLYTLLEELSIFKRVFGI